MNELIWTLLSIEGYMVLRIYKGRCETTFGYLTATQDLDGSDKWYDSYQGADFATGHEGEGITIFDTLQKAHHFMERFSRGWIDEYTYMVVPAVYAITQKNHDGGVTILNKQLVLPGMDFESVGGRAIGTDYEKAREAGRQVVEREKSLLEQV